MKHLFGGILACTLLLFACGGDDDDSADVAGTGTTAGDEGTSDPRAGAYVDAIAASMTDDSSGEALDEASADCIASAIVDVIGTERLTEAGITPEQLAEADSVADLDLDVPADTTDRLTDGITECGVGQAVSDVLVGEFSSQIGGELPADAADCIEGAVDERSAAEALATTFVEGTDDSIQSLMVGAVGQCPEVMTAVVIAQAPGPVSSEDAACIQGVIEDNRDVVMAALVEQDQESGEQLGALIAAGCPSVAGAFAGG